MSQQMVRFEQFFAAPREKVFAYFADHARFGRIWGGKFTRIKDAPGADVNGLGSVREIRNAGMRFEETITQYQPVSFIEYKVTRGGPVKNHVGQIRFNEVPGGTQVNYEIRFEPKIPLTGRLVAGILCSTFHGGIDRAVKDIAAAA